MPAYNPGILLHLYGMKCRWGIYLLFVLLPMAQVHAQSYDGEPKVFAGGLILGANFAQVDGDNFYGYHKIGLNAGGIVYIHFTPKVGASMELLYSQKGSRGQRVTHSPYAGDFVLLYFMSLNYVEVPVLFHYTVRKLDFEAGASYCRLINSSEWVAGDYTMPLDPVTNDFYKTDINYIFGLSRQVYKKFHLNFRFQYSFASMRSPDKIPAGFGYGNAGQFNNLINLRVLYMF
jgi:hypothetical protein